MTVQGKCSKPAGEYCRIHNPRPISLIMSKDDFGKYVNGEEKDSIGQRQLAETFPVSEYLHDELEARSLSPEELAEQMGVPSKVVFDLLDNGKFMDRNLADRLSAVLGTQPETWLGIQDSHLQHHSTNGKFETDTPQSQSKTLLAINKTPE
jgi:plasmid maintenance system antidote protein VapI